MREMTVEEKAFRGLWNAKHTQGALLMVDDQQGLRKTFALYLNIDDAPAWEEFYILGKDAVATLQRVALDGFGWLNTGNMVVTPRFLIDDCEPGRLSVWVNLGACDSEEDFKEVAVDAKIAESVWNESLRESTNAILTSVQLRGKYATPAFDTRALRQTDGESVAARLLAQLRERD